MAKPLLVKITSKEAHQGGGREGGGVQRGGGEVIWVPPREGKVLTKPVQKSYFHKDVDFRHTFNSPPPASSDRVVLSGSQPTTYSSPGASLALFFIIAHYISFLPAVNVQRSVKFPYS